MVNNTNHKWIKLNKFAIHKGYKIFDVYKCSECGAMGKKFRFGLNIVLDYRYRGKKDCVN